MSHHIDRLSLCEVVSDYENFRIDSGKFRRSKDLPNDSDGRRQGQGVTALVGGRGKATLLRREVRQGGTTPGGILHFEHVTKNHEVLHTGR